jgi:hypothetical protein
MDWYLLALIIGMLVFVAWGIWTTEEPDDETRWDDDWF